MVCKRTQRLNATVGGRIYRANPHLPAFIESTAMRVAEAGVVERRRNERATEQLELEAGGRKRGSTLGRHDQQASAVQQRSRFPTYCATQRRD